MTTPARSPQTREAAAEGVRRLAEWAAGVEFRDLPEAVLSKTALVIADNLAATVAARGETEVAALHEQAVRRGGREEATLFDGGIRRTDRVSAALANGIAGCWCELDEGYRLAPSHAGLYTLPVLLAESEADRHSVIEVLRAAAVSYEVATRFARTWRFPQLTVHPHPAGAAVGGAAAIASLRRFGSKAFLDAITAAATLTNVGHYDHAIDGILARNVWAAAGAVNGMRCADWAECGIGGAAGSPYSIFTTVLGIEPDAAALTDGLGSTWAILHGYHKLHSCCQSTHSAVEAMLDAVARLGTGAEAIDSIRLDTHRPGMSNPTPHNTLAARFSFEHVLAATAVRGEAGPGSFTAATLSDPSISRLRGRIELRAYEPLPPRPHDRPARVTLRLRDGREVQATCLSARGGPDRPFDTGTVLDKIATLTRDAYPAMHGELEELVHLEPNHLGKRWDALVALMTGQRPAAPVPAPGR